MAGSVLITGCSRGVGRALAQRYSESGWRVCATARNVRAIQALPAELHLPLDVCDGASIDKVIALISEKWGAVDLLINNAAVFPGAGTERLEAVETEWFAEAFATNVGGVVRVSKAALPVLRRGRQSKIVNISSGAGSISEKEDYSYYPYSVSKAALNMLTRAMAADLHAYEIAVVALSPGWVQTEMGGPNAEITPEESAASLFATIGRVGMAETGQFLGRDGAPYSW